jgi:hypothetical protein
LGFISVFFFLLPVWGLYFAFSFAISLNQSSLFLFIYFLLSTELIFFICYINSDTLYVDIRGQLLGTCWEFMVILLKLKKDEGMRSINLVNEVHSCKLCQVVCYMIGWWVVGILYFTPSYRVSAKNLFSHENILKDLSCHFLRSLACIC